MEKRSITVLLLSLILCVGVFSAFGNTSPDQTNSYAQTTFPGGKTKALLLSYDDGLSQDIRFIEILNKYGVKGTFNLNSGFFGGKAEWLKNVTGQEGIYLTQNQIAEIYNGHEIAGHTTHHPRLPALQRAEISKQIGDDQKALSTIANYSVRSFAYPFGNHDEKSVETLAALGFLSARTVENTGNFDIPKEPLTWHPTCHHSKALEYIEQFLHTDQNLATFSIWGHSWEFDKNESNNNWEYIETVIQQLSGQDDIWYTTAGEYFRFLEERFQ